MILTTSHCHNVATHVSSDEIIGNINTIIFILKRSKRYRDYKICYWKLIIKQLKHNLVTRKYIITKVPKEVSSYNIKHELAFRKINEKEREKRFSIKIKLIKTTRINILVFFYYTFSQTIKRNTAKHTLKPFRLEQNKLWRAFFFFFKTLKAYYLL